jgi:hypothetical protein
VKRYNVMIREVHVSHREVSAESEAEAIEKVADGEGEETFLEYSHTMGKDHWTVETKEDE